MDESPPTDDKKNGVVLTFPGGKSMTSDELGVPYVVGQSGQVPTPEVIDPKDIDKDVRDREAYVKRQELVQAIDQKAPASEVVDLVLKEITEELAHLKYERRKATLDGKNTANYTISRIASLRQLADVLLKRQENARAERLDLKGPEFKKVLRLWMEFLYESMTKVSIDDSTIDTIFKQMEADMADWEKKLVDIG
jgi:hypothetical protein